MTAVKGSHSVSDIQYHIVFITKYRTKILDKKDIEVVKEEANKIIKMVASGYGKDHIHFLVQAPPTLSPANIVKTIKEKSSKKIKLYKNEWKGWARGYFISSVSINSLEAVKHYIGGQNGEWNQKS